MKMEKSKREFVYNSQLQPLPHALACYHLNCFILNIDFHFKQQKAFNLILNLRHDLWQSLVEQIHAADLSFPLDTFS